VYTGNGVGFIPLAVTALALLLYTLLAPGWHARRNGGDHEHGAGHGPQGPASADGEPLAYSGQRKH
jgi:hypothetical protein